MPMPSQMLLSVISDHFRKTFIEIQPGGTLDFIRNTIFIISGQENSEELLM